jgi:uncharacterized protein (DUF433 family)
MMNDYIEPKNLDMDIIADQRGWTAKSSLSGDEVVDPIREWKRKLPALSMFYSEKPKKPVSVDVLVSMRMTYAAYLLNELIEVDGDKAGGTPVLKGTKFKISRILGEIADGRSVSKLAKDFRLDIDKVVAVLHGMAIYLDRSFTK